MPGAPSFRDQGTERGLTWGSFQRACSTETLRAAMGLGAATPAPQAYHLPWASSYRLPAQVACSAWHSLPRGGAGPWRVAQMEARAGDRQE